MPAALPMCARPSPTNPDPHHEQVRKTLSQDLWELMPTHGGERALRAPLDRSARLADTRIGRAASRPGGGLYEQYGMSGLAEGAHAEYDPAVCELECLECAVASLGKAISLLAPLSNPIGRSLSDDELERAVSCISSAAAVLQKADPDRPLSPEEWRQVALGLL